MSGSVTIDFCGELFHPTPEEPLTIGRVGDVVIDDNPFLHRTFLTVSEESGLWWLSNVGSVLTATVGDPDGRFQAWLAPGARIPLAMERFRVWFTAGPTTYDFDIIVDSPAFTVGTVGLDDMEDVDDEEERDRLEADALFDLLERQVVPLFFDRRRGQGSGRRGWLRRVKHDLASLGPEVVASRMVRDYVTDLYEPTATTADDLGASGRAPARELAAWKVRVIEAWAGVKVGEVVVDEDPAGLGQHRSVKVSVELGSLAPDDVAVQLVHGSVGQGDELADVTVTDLELAGDTGSSGGNGSATFTGSVECARPGRYGFTVRVAPSHPGLSTPLEMGRLTWA